MTNNTITPDLIPHNLFHRGTWLLEENAPFWYYFLARENAHHIRNKNFNASVDEPLKEMVNFLHKWGIQTTASCAGHDKDVFTFQKIYDALEIDKYRIRSNGLMLKDIESGNKILDKDVLYDLPWTSRGFVNKAVNYQQNGVIGLMIKNQEYIARELFKILVPAVEYSIKDGIFIIQMHPHPAYSNEERWKIITGELKRIIMQAIQNHFSYSTSQ